VSPNGQSVLFQALVDGLTQVGVMNLASGHSQILTRDRSRGLLIDPAWSLDGSRIYFDRYFDAPAGIFSVSERGGDEHLVLPNAMAPRPLPDGSLLALRVNANRKHEVVRFWPESARLQPVGALIKDSVVNALRVFPDGREAVFLGRPASTPDAPDHLHAIDLQSGATRRLAPAVALPDVSWMYPMAATIDSVLFNLPSGNLHRIVAAPRDGSSGMRTLVTLTAQPDFLDAGSAGDVYVDQRSGEIAQILRYNSADRTTERTPLPGDERVLPLLPLPDGRALVPRIVGGKRRVMLMKRGAEPVSFVQTEEESNWPMAMIGAELVAIRLGTGSKSRIALVTASEGRIVRYLDLVAAPAVRMLAGAPDGRRLFYVSEQPGSAVVMAVSAEGGEPERIRAGDAVAVDPAGKYLVVQLSEGPAVRLVRMPLSGGPEEEIPIAGPYRLAPFYNLGPSAVAQDGRLAVRVTSQDSWFWPAAILNPVTGRLDLIAGGREDMYAPGWESTGRLITMSVGVRSQLWRFRQSER
jgi:hypothetical protein